MKKLSACIMALLLLLSAGCGRKAPGETASSEPAPSFSPLPADMTIEDMAVSLVSDMAAGEFDKVFSIYPYTAEMKKVITGGESVKEQIWDPLVRTYGKFSEITGTSESQYQDYDIISVKTSFEKGKLYINVVFDKENRIAGINFAPDPENATSDAPPEGITETELTFGKSGWELTGTLTLPAGKGPFPAVILVHGSGPNDRDETVGPNKPFRDIAMGLAQKGIATFRYDKRTLAHQKEFASLTDYTVYDETIEDAVLAYELLRDDESIDPGRIYILGHSLGGMLIPRIAKLTADAAGYIIMSAPVTPLEDLMVKQLEYLNELDGTVSDIERRTLRSYETMRDNVKALTDDSDTPSEQLFGIPASYWLDLKDYRPEQEAKSIHKPVLILQGERDYQVTMDEFRTWKDALSENDNVTFKSYDGLNHLMIYGTGKPGPQEYNSPGKVDERVIEDMASWVLESRELKD